MDLIRKSGVEKSDWLYIEYCTWAGQIESVSGFVCLKGTSKIAVDDDDIGSVQKSNLRLMDGFDVNREQALDLPLLRRGFWN